MTKATLEWSPTKPEHKPDNIISSENRAKKYFGFTPSYEHERKPHMSFLMSNEYMRIWFKERAMYEKSTYTKDQTIKEESKIKRKHVQRLMTYRRPGKNSFIEEQVQEKIRPKQVQANSYDKLKFKPDCPLNSQKIAVTTRKVKHKNNTSKAMTEKNKSKAIAGSTGHVINCCF